MSRTIVLYDEEQAGRITGTLSIDGESLARLNRAYLAVEIFQPDYDVTHYVSDGVLTERPASVARQTVEGLTDLPVPCEVVINGKVYPVDESNATLSFTHPGIYEIAVIAFPFRDAVFIYEVAAT